MTQRISKKVLLIGWDAADWVMIKPLIDQGLMPTLTQLIKDGTSGKLATIRPILSPMLWNSIATGKRADKHGIHGFTEPLPDGTGIRPVSSTSRKTKAIWNILSQNGLKSNVVSWFASHPAEPINGAIVTDRYVTHLSPDPGPPGALDGTFHPARLADDLVKLRVDPRLLDAQAVLPFIPRAGELEADKDERLSQFLGLLSRASTVHAAACWMMLKEPWDFMAVYYDAIDQFGHNFMAYHPPAIEGISERDADIFKDVMNGCYRYHDMMLESLLNYAGEETTVILVSDHGFHSGSGRHDTDGFKDPESWHRPFGVVCAKGPGIRKDNHIYGATLLDVTPTILSLFGLPIGADMDGRPWLEIFDTETRAENIISWDAVKGDDGMHDEDMREDPVASAEAIRHLVELGYIDAPSEDAQENVRKTLQDQKLNLAKALSDSNRVANAIPIWQELLEQDPENAVPYKFQLSRCYLRTGRMAECESLQRELLETNPKSAILLASLGQTLLQQEKPDEALKYLKQAETIAPRMEALLGSLGQAYVQLDNFDDAERAFKTLLEIDEENSVAYNGLARVAISRKQFEQAVDFALRAVGLTHQFPRAHYNLGVALAETGRTEQAIQALQTCVAMSPAMATAHLWLAKLLAAEGRDPEQARKHEMIARQFANAAAKK
ncbi:MAG: alkaline phosphatase family protein [Phycisphaerales bacterium]